MRPRLFTFASWLSLLLCAATVTLSERSRRVGDELIRSRSQSEFRLYSVNGLLWVGWGRRYMGTPLTTGWQHHVIYFPDSYVFPSGLEHSVGGDAFEVLWGNGGGIAWHAVVCHYFLLCLLFVILPAWVPIRAYSRWQAAKALARRHLCRRCGYNLTGNMSGVCPECGTNIRRERPK